MAPTDVFSSTGGRVLTGGAALAAVLVVASLAGEVAPADLLLAAFLGALTVLAVWAAFGRPAVEVSDGTVVLRNVLRTVTIPWPTLQRVEVGWSLVLHTTGGRWTAWAAPRSGGAGRAVRRPRHGEPASDVEGRPRAATAEVVAAAIEERRDALRAAGYLDDAERVAAEHGLRPAVRWHTRTLTAALVLTVGAVATRLV